MEVIKNIKYALPLGETNTAHYSTIYSVYKRLLNFNILKNTYIDLLKIYLKKTPNKKLKYQYTDTTVVANKCRSKYVQYNCYVCRYMSKGICAVVAHLGIYDVKKFKWTLFDNMYIVITPINKKNKKYEKIGKLTKNEKRMYLKRIVIGYTDNKLK